MKKLLFAFLLFTSYLVPGTAFAQSKTYFHDRVDTTIYATTTGTNTYVGTNTDPNFNVAVYMRGLMVSTFIVNGNTGAATYRLVTRTGTLSSVAIKKANGAALVSGDIPDSTAVLLLYYGSFWRLVGIHSAPSTFWSLTGNAGTTAGTNFLGTTDATDISFKRNSTEIMRMGSSGLGIFTTSPQFPLHIKKGIADPHIFACFEQTNGGVDSCAANIRMKGIGHIVDWGIEDDKDFLVYSADTLRFNFYSTRKGNFEIGVLNGAVQDVSRLYVRSNKTSDFILMAKNSTVYSGMGYDADGGYCNINNSAGNLQTVKFSNSGNCWINPTAGTLGLFTSSPASDYHVTLQGSGTYDGIIIKDAQGDINSFIGYYQGEGGGWTLLDHTGTTVIATINNHFRPEDYINTGKNFGIGLDASTAAKLHVKGAGSTSATNTVLFENSSGTDLFTVRNDGAIASTYSINATAGDAITIDKAAGQFVKDATGTTFTLTNALITTSSQILYSINTTGVTTGYDIAVVAGSGSAVFTFQTAGIAAAPNIDTKISFWVINY